MTVLEQWIWEFMIILSGMFSVLEQSSQVILTTINLILFQFGQGFDQTACALIGNALGSGNYIDA